MPITPFRLSACMVVLAALVLFVLHINSASGRPELDAENARIAFAADLQNGKLNTPEAFGARCGAPQKVTHAAGRTELEYTFAEIYVTFGPARPPILESETTDIGSDGRVKSNRIPASPFLVFELLGCK